MQRNMVIGILGAGHRGGHDRQRRPRQSGIATGGHHQTQRKQPLWMGRRHDLGHHAAHRRANHMRLLHLQRVEQAQRITRHISKLVRWMHRCASGKTHHDALDIRCP